MSPVPICVALAVCLYAARAIAAGDRALPAVVTKNAAVLARCPKPKPLTPEQESAQRLIEAHQLIEREGGQAYARDPELQQRVIAALRVDPRIARSAITVQARRRNIELTGCVRTRGQARQVEARVRRVDGVVDVWNELRLAR